MLWSLYLILMIITPTLTHWISPPNILLSWRECVQKQDGVSNVVWYDTRQEREPPSPDKFGLKSKIRASFLLFFRLPPEKQLDEEPLSSDPPCRAKCAPFPRLSYACDRIKLSLLSCLKASIWWCCQLMLQS